MKKEEYSLQEIINDMKRSIEQFEENSLKILTKMKEEELRKERKGD